ncbi:venom protease-like [Chironomus tepperi]|uniref:venom protease-like n=1 Tax=Chironomus tepperi TaxID=113505 RepID=UPI00391F9900
MDIQTVRISEKKCKEYENYVQKNTSVSRLIGQAPIILKTNVCQHKTVPLILGGTESQLSEFPHQALLGYPEATMIDWKCGGSIVSSHFILTAAHCTKNNLTFVKVGMLSRLEDNANTAIYRISSIFVHPNYKSLIDNEDIALVRLQKNIKFNEHIYPICLPTKQDDHWKAIVTGFGNLGNGMYSDKLMKVVVEKFDHDECKQLYEPKSIFQDTMLCYGDKRKSRDSCDGDSGGPLQVSNDNNVYCTYTQIGIVSFGSSQCGVVGFPAVYVNVYNYIDWIERTVWPGGK